MARQASSSASGSHRPVNVQYNLEKAPLQSGVTDPQRDWWLTKATLPLRQWLSHRYAGGILLVVLIVALVSIGLTTVFKFETLSQKVLDMIESLPR